MRITLQFCFILLHYFNKITEGSYETSISYCFWQFCPVTNLVYMDIYMCITCTVLKRMSMYGYSRRGGIPPFLTGGFPFLSFMVYASFVVSLGFLMTSSN